MEKERQENGNYKITPDEERRETQRGVLRAVGIAALKKAGVFTDSNAGVATQAKIVDRHIHQKLPEGLSLEIGFVPGHQIKTNIFPDSNNALILSGHQYERDHGENPEGLLDSARAILEKNPDLNTMVVEQQPSATPTELPRKGGVLGKLGTIFNKGKS